jgi:hypothetical protein
MYQACRENRKKFGEKLVIIGDQQQIKNGWQYAVWGASADPSTWYE